MIKKHKILKIGGKCKMDVVKQDIFLQILLEGNPPAQSKIPHSSVQDPALQAKPVQDNHVQAKPVQAKPIQAKVRVLEAKPVQRRPV